jgi:hypothetical protein
MKDEVGGILGEVQEKRELNLGRLEWDNDDEVKVKMKQSNLKGS